MSSEKFNMHKAAYIPSKIMMPWPNQNYLHSVKAKADQKPRYYQHREKILQRQIPELTHKHACASSLHSYWNAGKFSYLLGRTDWRPGDGAFEISFRQPEVAVALTQIVQNVQERRSVPNLHKSQRFCHLAGVACHNHNHHWSGGMHRPYKGHYRLNP